MTRILRVCVLAVLLGAACVFAPKPKVNVLLIVLDSVRADRLRCYGAEYAPMPQVDSLAAVGVTYINCQSQAPWTLPSMTSVWTGVSQRSHRVNTTPSGMYGIAEEYETLPEIMQDAGFDTYGFFNITSVGEDYGFWRGVDHADGRGSEVPPMLPASEAVNTALTWLDERHNASGWFMYLHLADAHWPYDPPIDYWNRLGVARPAETPSAHSYLRMVDEGTLTDTTLQLLHALYLAEMMSMDEELARLFGELRRRGLAENTIVVVIADHGEEFMEHGYVLHGFQLFQETVHVPWVMAGPLVPVGKTVSQPVGLYDVLPTLAYYLGLEYPSYVEGIPAVEGQPTHTYIPCSGDQAGVSETVVIRYGNYKVFGGPGVMPVGFDLDAGGENPTDMRMVDEALAQMVLDYWATPTLFAPMEVPSSQDRADALRGLGYIR